jgi:hypothetical protein
MTRPRTWALLGALALAPLGSSACENATDDLLADKACTPAGQCATGYECNDARVCVPAGTASGGTGAASAGGGGSAEGGAAATSTGSGGFVCGEDPAPVGGDCPAVCNGGCVGTTCMIECTASNECNRDQIQCPEAFDCNVLCNGTNACKDALFTCSSQHACEVTCEDGCSGAEVQCGEGVCRLTCSETGAVCTNVDLLCGPDECQATCEGGSEPTVECGASCDCRPCS